MWWLRRHSLASVHTSAEAGALHQELGRGAGPAVKVWAARDWPWSSEPAPRKASPWWGWLRPSMPIPGTHVGNDRHKRTGPPEPGSTPESHCPVLSHPKESRGSERPLAHSTHQPCSPRAPLSAHSPSPAGHAVAAESLRPGGPGTPESLG